MVTKKDTSALLSCYRESIKPKAYREPTSQQVGSGGSNIVRRGGQPTKNAKENSEVLKKLQELGITVFNPEDKINDLDWDFLAGYEKQKRDIEDTILLALNYPQVYEDITEGTRMKK